MSYPRDLIGYGANPPHPQWQGDAKIALQIVLNYEEGSEYSIPDGDDSSEIYLREVPGSSMGKGMRDLQVESVYEYGSRAGFWRLMRLFKAKDHSRNYFWRSTSIRAQSRSSTKQLWMQDMISAVMVGGGLVITY